MLNIHINSSQKKIIACLCALLVIIDALYVFTNIILPVIDHTTNLSHNLATIKFDFSILFRCFYAYSLLILGISLPGRSRVAWVASLCTLVLVLFGGLWFVHSIHYTIIVCISIIILALSYRIFDQQLYLSYTFVFVFAFILYALLYGSIGSYLLRDSFQGIHNIPDAIYFTFITYSTVGYGDIVPINNTGKLFVISMVIIGLILFTTGITLIAYIMNTKLKDFIFNVNKGKISMNNHIVLIGYGFLARILIEQYRKSNENFVIIDQSQDLDPEKKLLMDKNELMLSPYPGHQGTLLRARINEAKVIIINFDSDIETIFAIMSVTEFLKPYKIKPQIIARIFYEENIKKAIQVGATEVIAPHLLAAEAILKYKIR